LSTKLKNPYKTSVERCKKPGIKQSAKSFDLTDNSHPPINRTIAYFHEKTLEKNKTEKNRREAVMIWQRHY